MRGELAALIAAFLWAVSTVIFGRLGKQLPPLILNFVKGSIAIALIGITLSLRQIAPFGLPQGAVLLLLASGAIGIGLGDTAYFATVNHLGARRALLMESLAPPIAALLAGIGLGETLELQAWAGILLTLVGVSWVISERVPNQAGVEPSSWRGVVFGLLAALGQAIGAVLSRAALVDTSVDPLVSTLLRLAAGLGTMLVLLIGQRRGFEEFRPLRSQSVLLSISIAAFLGTYLAIWLQQTSLKYAATGIAQSLSATSPLFVLPIAVLLGDRVSLRAYLGVLVALAGVWLLLSR